MTPAETHAAVLAGLSRLGGALSMATNVPWHIGHAADPLSPCNLHTAVNGDSIADNVALLDAEVIAMLRNSALPVLRGRRRIIERHAPIDYGKFGVSCQSHDHAGPGPSFPCDEYLDAAADLMPEGAS